ncbi:extracellular solute-binding protein [Salinibacterium sp. ZJ450]|uniref:extracellular solute-binding protein n=1 Tax=Salinibacterium sp. ZJ450 TaxID=2708338 RepID=UPI00141ED9DC|nr:extracellular solute-binding protein [Salinibacterium sp. ZJ450]
MYTRNLAVTAAAMVCLLTLASCSADSGGSTAEGETDGGQLVFVNYGGESLKAAEAGWIDPFSKATGFDVVTDSPSDFAKIRTMVEGGRTTWDVVEIDTAVGGGQCGVLFEERPADLDLSEVNPAYITDECMVPIMVQAVGVVYNKKLYGDTPPTRPEDFLDMEKYPGKRIAFNYPAGTLEPMLMADGVAPEDVVPIQWDHVEGIFDRLGDDLILMSQHTQVVAALEAGDFGMCLCYLGRAATAAENGADIAVLWDKLYVAAGGAYAVKGSSNPDAQWAFLQHLATSEGQNPFYEMMPYGPTTTGEPPAVKDVYKEFMPSFHEDKIRVTYPYDVPYWSENIDQAMNEWTRVTSGG